MAQLVEKIVDFTEQLQQTAAEEVGVILKARKEIKREQGSSEVAASDAGVSTTGNITHTTLSEPIVLDPPSPSHKSSHSDDIPFRSVYSNLQKAKIPTQSNKTLPKPDDVSVIKEYEPPVVKPLQVLQPGETFEGDSEIPP